MLGRTHKSPKETLCLRAKGFCSPTISSRPMLASKFVSSSAKAMMEPSAPPPPNLPSLNNLGEKLMASWKVS